MRKTLILSLVLSMLALPTTVLADDSTSRKAVLVTGASSGIGLKVAQKLAANGFYVYAGARKSEDLKRLDAMENISSVRLDVTVQDEIDAAVDFVKKQGRGLWGLVNNAGVAFYAPLVDGPESDLMLTMEVNVIGPYRVNRAFLPLLMESKGRTTVISSISAFIPGRSGSYSMSKSAVEAYTDTLANELAGSGVHVSAVQPGAFKSRIVEKLKDRALSHAAEGTMDLDEETRASLKKSAAAREAMKEPDAVAQAVLSLMTSDEPQRRYMVTPNEEQAHLTIRSAMQRLLELNTGQPYAYDRDGLVELLDELLKTQQPDA